MSLRNKKPLLFIVAAAGLALFTYGQLRSHRADAASGITVAPAFINATLTPEAPEQHATVGVRNDFGAPIQVHVSVRGIDQQSGILSPTDQPDQSLVRAVELSPTEFSVQPGQSLNVKLRIKDTPELSPGGHYATLLIRQVSTVSQQVSLEPAISATLFVVKEQGAVRKLELKDIATSRNIFSLPKTVDLTFSNGGNVHVVPRAALQLQRGGGNVYSNGIANERSIPMLPRRDLKIRTEMTQLKRSWLPGRYSLIVQYRYDGAPASAQATATFWYVPPIYLLPLLLLMAIVYYRFRDLRRLASARRLSKLVVPPRKKPFQPKTAAEKPKKKINIKDGAQD